jgi:hydrogenase expression/formation protein HypE
MNRESLPVGKIPAELLGRFLARAPTADSRVILGPGIGLDCAVVESGAKLLVFKSDPVTFVAEEIGYYAVHVNANDIATTGAVPCWMLVTFLLPEAQSTPAMVEGLFEQVARCCREIGVTLIGGHSEVTHGLQRPIVAGTMVGEVDREKLVTPRGAAPGDRLLLTKGVPLEATAVLARELPDRLTMVLDDRELATARNFLADPGISILRDARIALNAGRVSAMHDPTEGGLLGALWELAEASGRSLFFDPESVPVPSLARKICDALCLDPLAAIASGALLLAAPEPDARAICRALAKEGIPCAEIGKVQEGPATVLNLRGAKVEKIPWPSRDELARIFENLNRAGEKGEERSGGEKTPARE